MSFSSYLKIKLSKQGVSVASSIEITYSAIFSLLSTKFEIPFPAFALFITK